MDDWYNLSSVWGIDKILKCINLMIFSSASILKVLLWHFFNPRVTWHKSLLLCLAYSAVCLHYAPLCYFPLLLLIFVMSTVLHLYKVCHSHRIFFFSLFHILGWTGRMFNPAFALLINPTQNLLFFMLDLYYLKLFENSSLNTQLKQFSYTLKERKLFRYMTSGWEVEGKKIHGKVR